MPAKQIDTSIPISLDPAILNDPVIANPFNVGQTDQAPVKHAAWSVAMSTMEGAYAIAEKLATAQNSIAKLGRQPDPALDNRLRRSARAMMAEARKRFDAAYVSLGEHVQQLEAESSEIIGIGQSRNGVCDNQRAAEVRSWLRNLPTSLERWNAVSEAMSAGDNEVVAAVLAGSPVLSGVPRDVHAQLQLEAREKFAPTPHRLIEGIDRLTSILKTADGAMVKGFDKITGEGSRAAAEAERAVLSLERGATNA